MILFKSEHVDMILSGRKTQTRRIWKKNHANVGSIQQARTELFGKPFAYLHITKRWNERLGDISKEDCIKEGYEDILSYSRIWLKINGVWEPKLIVSVIEFRRIKN